MASELLALLAAGGLMATGANPVSETRSAQALPVGKFVAVSAPAKGPMGRCLVKPGKFGGKATVVCGKQNLQAAVAGGIAGGLGETAPPSAGDAGAGRRLPSHANLSATRERETMMSSALPAVFATSIRTGSGPALRFACIKGVR